MQIHMPESIWSISCVPQIDLTEVLKSHCFNVLVFGYVEGFTVLFKFLRAWEKLKNTKLNKMMIIFLDLVSQYHKSYTKQFQATQSIPITNHRGIKTQITLNSLQIDFRQRLEEKTLVIKIKDQPWGIKSPEYPLESVHQIDRKYIKMC